MTRFIAAAALLLAASIPAQAGTILPYTYAKTFCELRIAGASKDDAVKAAVKAAFISGDDWTQVTIDGKQYQSDTILAVRTAFDLCPELFK
jgi:hypothetical protein